jgi:phosphoribosylamine--glycine ligase
MGSLSMQDHRLPYVTPEDFQAAKDIMNATLIAVRKKTGSSYKGILYGQFMKTNSGVKVIEYNARFGDPEAMNVLSILTSSMDEICQGIIDGNLGRVQFENKATVCVYIVPEGYPGPDAVKDSPIDLSVATTALVYHASVYEENNQILTTGSRAIGVVGTGDTLAQAREIAYANASRIKGQVRFRSDIAK